ncbi:beta-sandwich lipoprotein [Lacticaseibacillus yichunensis]|uniref:Lipoprotein n=1 Tax=Lacticaseibacillus yichunensis TaxID=2486015 RepID=A0ABW4CKZ4_9LACO|nr:hypothetical protein [Lacticaseibacillus yichunensis]
MKKKLAGMFLGLAMLMTLGGCASWNRFTKNVSSDVNNGLPREIKVYNAEGKVIFHEKGKFDISYKDRDLQYIDQKNRKHNIYLGDMTTVVVDELK